jgi:hypothetical protein
MPMKCWSTAGTERPDHPCGTNFVLVLLETLAGITNATEHSSTKRPVSFPGTSRFIEDFRFHDLRHTWASWHVQSGTSLPELMELGGWKSYEMVLRYAHLAPEKLSSVASRIERQPAATSEDAPRSQNVAASATFSLRSVN